MAINYPPLLRISTITIKGFIMNVTSIFATSDNTTSYTSLAVTPSVYGNRTIVFQASLSVGDQVVLQARLSDALPYVDVLTITEENAMQEVVNAPDFRVVVTNTSGNPVVAAISV